MNYIQSKQIILIVDDEEDMRNVLLAWWGTARGPAPPWAPCPRLQSVQGRRKSEDGSNDPPAPG